MDQNLFTVAFGCYGASVALSFGYVLTRQDRLANWAKNALGAGVLLHGLNLALRTWAVHRIPHHDWYVPWSNWYESFSFFAFIIASEYLLIHRKTHWPIMGAFVSPLVLLVMSAGLFAPRVAAVPAMPPALESGWVIAHVPVVFLAYGGFAHAFIVGLAYLIQERQIKSKRPGHLAFRLPPLDDLDSLIYRIILWAWPCLLVGMGLGAMWAHHVLGRYWQWDPKQTWALITWLIYGICLFLRKFLGWRGRKTAYLSLLGFGVILFTYIGVNYFSKFHVFLAPGVR